jgi:RecA/RadA recombinase
MATSTQMPGLSPAANDLGLGDMLGQQVAGETEEQRKKRMLELQQRRQMGPTGSLAVTSLFGANGGLPGAGY